MPDTEIVVADQPRSELVRLQIVHIKEALVRDTISLARLLKEARDNRYHNSWGYSRFGDWVEQGSGLDISERSAYDFIKVIEVAERLQIPDADLEAIKISSLKSIASLPDTTSSEQMKTLIYEAKDMPYKEVRELVGQIKNENFTYHTLKFDQDTEDNVFQPALEFTRREYGNTMGPDGEAADISDSRCVELWAADRLAGAPLEDTGGIMDAEFEDATDSLSEDAA